MNLINFFLRSKFFDKINSFLARKIFKLLKIFFIETYLSSLPKINYPLKNIETDLFNSKKFLNTNSIPYMSYPQLPHLVQIMYEKQNNLTFFDYGAGNLSLYNYLNRKYSGINYYFKDQDIIEKKVAEIINKNRIENLFIGDKKNTSHIDILFFGSSIQYINNYKEELSFFLKRSKYILIAQTPFFQNDELQDKIVLKQINMHPNINYLYLFNLSSFLKYMSENNFELVEKSINKVTKFLNFKNFDRQKYKNINMYDLLFKLK